MKLAVNYSPILIDLLEAQPELPVDYIKVPTTPFPGSFSQFETGICYRKLLPHPAQPGVLALGHPDPEQRFNPAMVAEIIRRAEPPHLSTHLEARTEYFPELRGEQHSRGGPFEEVLFKRFVAAAQEVKAATGLPLLIENFPYYSWWWHFWVGSAPEFITAVCEAADCFLLVDIAHARCSAAYQGRDPWDYIAAMPLERLREIHISGIRKRQEGWRDTHTAIGVEEYKLLKLLLERATPEIVTIEYGGLPDRIQNLDFQFEPISRNDPAELEEMIRRVGEIIAEGLYQKDSRMPRKVGDV